MVTTTGSRDEGDEQQGPKLSKSDIALLTIAAELPGNARLWNKLVGSLTRSSDYALRQYAVQEVAKADPNNIQEVAASQLSIINSYYQSGLQQSQQSFLWSLRWGGIGLGFLIAAIGFLLFRQPTEVAIASGIGGAFLEVFAGTYLYLYKHASDQFAAFRAGLESTQRLLLANSMCEKLEGEVEQTTRAELIRLMVNSAVQLQGIGTGKK